MYICVYNYISICVYIHLLIYIIYIYIYVYLYVYMYTNIYACSGSGVRGSPGIIWRSFSRASYSICGEVSIPKRLVFSPYACQGKPNGVSLRYQHMCVCVCVCVRVSYVHVSVCCREPTEGLCV